MRKTLVQRSLESAVRERLRRSPVVAILGPRQCGKSTLAREIAQGFPGTVRLDLERAADRRKLDDPEAFFNLHANHLVCLDEIQQAPEVFSVLRSVVDEHRRPGRFLVLGSASFRLLRQSSETLAGRISYLELTPFLDAEVNESSRCWLRGGFPESYLARTDRESAVWREDFIRTFIERDIGQFGISVPPRSVERLWRMCAHYHGQLLNQSRLGESLGVSHHTVRSYLDLLSDTYMIRLLPPFLPNLGKRLVKSPRVYLRDSGILHSLLDIGSHDDLLGHPVRGASWEGWVIENILAEMPGWRGHFFRTSRGAEIDLVLEKGRQRIAVECKASTAPEPAPGFWESISDLDITDAWIVAPVKDSYPVRKGVTVGTLQDFLHAHR